MAKVHKITGYDEFKKTIDDIAKTAENVNVLFSGKKGETGQSWCCDCNDGKIFLFMTNKKNGQNRHQIVNLINFS